MSFVESLLKVNYNSNMFQLIASSSIVKFSFIFLVVPLAPDCTYSVDLLMTVSSLALALHMSLFVPPCLFPVPVCINICVLLFV